MIENAKSRIGICFVTLKLRRRYIVAAAVAFVLLGVSAAAFLAMRGESTETFVTPIDGKVVIVDPGHGGADSGAVANGAVEKELNLEISKLLSAYIEEGGGTAILTRTEDADTADPNRGAGVSWKQSDLNTRKEDIKNFDADVFVSIHMNKFPQTKYHGAQVFYTEGSDESKILGETIQTALKEFTDNTNTRAAKPSGSAIYVLKENTVPSALVECGFLSNAEEARRLRTEEYRRRTAWGIYIGLVRYFSR